MNSIGEVDQVAVELAKLLEQHAIPYAIIGGLANLVWGTPRLTRDVDVTINLPDPKLGHVLQCLAPVFRARIKDAAEFALQSRVLLLEHAPSGIPVDVVLATLPYEEQAIARGRPITLSGGVVQVCRAEDLILHKIVSDRTRDREDIRGIIKRQGSGIERSYLDPLVHSLARELENPEVWDFYQSCFQKG